MTELTAAELDFELRCRKEYEKQTGRELDPNDFDPGIAFQVMKAVRQQMFDEKFTR